MTTEAADAWQGEDHAGAAATGHDQVDEVLASLSQLASRGIDEHVPIFEQAHQALQRALANAANDAPEN